MKYKKGDIVTITTLHEKCPQHWQQEVQTGLVVEITDEEIKITCREGTVVSISRRQIMEVVVKE